MKRVLLSGVASLLLFALHAPVQASSTTYSFFIYGNNHFRIDSSTQCVLRHRCSTLNYSFTYTYDPLGANFRFA